MLKHLPITETTNIASTTVQSIATTIRKDVGDPTVVINNAGLAMGKPWRDTTEDTIRKMFDMNILSHFWMAQEFWPEMIRRDHGHIVSVASIAAYITIASNSNCSATKASVKALHERLGQDLRHRYGT